jgi:hypothetical protein
MRATILLPVALCLAVLTAPTEAHALGPIDLEIAAKVGYANNPGSGDPNPLGVGLGGRAGVSFMGAYGGVNILYYFGGTSNVNIASVSANSLLYGIEAGYGVTLVDILTIRAQLGVGNITISSNHSGSVGSVTASAPSSLNNLYLEPGLTGLLGFGTYFVGVDANLLILPSIAQQNGGGSSTETCFTLHGQIGVKF